MKGKIFNAQEVQAIISGNKTQFREVIKSQPKNTEYCGKNSLGAFVFHEKEMQDCVELIHSPYKVGQKIFCKESFSSYYEDNGLVRGDVFLYRADEDSKELEDVHWKPAQHMKQEHSRLTLLIKEIKVERLQDISEEDAIAEGCENFVAAAFCKPEDRVHVRNFKNFWNATHKKPEEKFEESPFVWKIEFEVVKND